MNTNPIVIGMIGAGFSATFHVHNYRLVPGLDIRIKGVTARTQESATVFAEEHNLETVYPTAEALFADEEITVVDLCVPNYLHYPLTVQAAEAGKHIICEKPLTGYFGDGGDTLVGRETPRRKMFEAALKAADEMVDVVRRNGVTFCYGENWVHASQACKRQTTSSHKATTPSSASSPKNHTAVRIPITQRNGDTPGAARFSIRVVIPLAGRST